jgi:hypothetical protein
LRRKQVEACARQFEIIQRTFAIQKRFHLRQGLPGWEKSHDLPGMLDGEGRGNAHHREHEQNCQFTAGEG